MGIGRRALGLDLGSKRIGVATSDLSGTIASPHSVVTRTRRSRDLLDEVARLVSDEEIEVVVVGLPIRLDGSHGTAAEAATREARLIGTVIDVPVVLFDERFTTVAADRALREAEIRASDRRRVVDKVAAAVMLQAWIDAGGPGLDV
jgi:putative Holliday junction resolvase